MTATSLMFNLSDLADSETLAAALVSASLSALAGAKAATQLHRPEFRWPAALVGAASIVFTMVPSMILGGSIGAGIYALLEMALQVRDGNETVGKAVVVISTALGCAFVAWILCLALLSVPAVLLAIHRRARNS